MNKTKTNRRDTDVLVIGAGPTGLMMANMLARGEAKFRIVDSKNGPTKQTRALVVHAKTLELFDKIGVAGRAVEEGRKLGAAELFREGRYVGKLSFLDDDKDDRTPYPFVLIYEQSQNERLLLDALGKVGGRVEWNTELLNIEPSDGGVSATVRRPDGSEETIEAGWVVGADGASSLVRHSLSLGFEGDTYEQTLFLADIELEWSLDERRAYITMTRQGFYAFFPMPGENRFRLVGSVPEELEGKEEITARDVQSVLDNHSGLQASVTNVRWTSTYRIHRRMAERFRVGRVFLVGDSAHVHSPAGGQGMNTGIGDAYNLGWKLALAARARAHESLLDSYEAERMPFARAILGGSDRGFSLQVATTPATQRLKILAVPKLFKLISRPPLRGRVFWLISQLWTGYRDSPAVAQFGPAKKGPKAGERAPHGFFEVGPEASKSIFEKLRGPDHHLLVFEGPRSDPDRLEATYEEAKRVLDRYGAPFVVHRVPAGNKELHERYGARRPSLFLIRPDGHVAYRDAATDIVGLKMYLNRVFTRSPSHTVQNVYPRDAENVVSA